jgi:mannitol-specific phosphotransferase system IIBC component
MIQGLFRAGYIARGLVYLIPGVLALRLAIGTHGAMITQTETIGVIGRQPQGRLLLLLLAAGLAGYALWGMARAVLDPLGRGHSVQGIFDRLGYAMSGLA